MLPILQKLKGMYQKLAKTKPIDDCIRSRDENMQSPASLPEKIGRWKARISELTQEDL
jgi:hypothetical protein